MSSDLDIDKSPARSADLQLLPLVADGLATPWNDLFEPDKVVAREVTASSITGAPP
jgi:hypothetical protein